MTVQAGDVLSGSTVKMVRNDKSVLQNNREQILVCSVDYVCARACDCSRKVTHDTAALIQTRNRATPLFSLLQPGSDTSLLKKRSSYKHQLFGLFWQQRGDRKHAEDT